MKLLRTLAAGPLALAAFGWATPAFASKTAGKLQVGVTTPVFSSIKVTETHEAGGEDIDTSISGTEWGVQNQVTGEFGYGMGKVAVLGLIVQTGGASTTADPDPGSKVDDANFNLMVGPKLDIMLRYGKTVRPFLGFGGGYATSWVTNEGIKDGVKYKDSSGGFRLIGRLWRQTELV